MEIVFWIKKVIKIDKYILVIEFIFWIKDLYIMQEIFYMYLFLQNLDFLQLWYWLLGKWLWLNCIKR